MAYPANDRHTSRCFMEPTTYFGRVLDGILKVRGLSARQAEIRCGISYAHLSRIRHGHHGGTFGVVAALEAGLALSDEDVCRLLIASFNDAKERRARGKP